MAVNDSLLPLWLWNRNELPDENRSWSGTAWKTSCESLLFILVTQCDLAKSEYGK